MGVSGSVDYMFTRKGQFKIKAEGVNPEELELELIDHGLDDMQQEDEHIVLYCSFEDYGSMQKALEDRKIEVQSAELLRFPSHTKELSDDQAEEVIKLIEKLEEDEDVINVFHNMDMTE